jgi:hypothetical protein
VRPVVSWLHLPIGCIQARKPATLTGGIPGGAALGASTAPCSVARLAARRQSTELLTRRQGAPRTWVADLRQIQPHPKAGAMGQLVNAGVEADSAQSLQILRVERRGALLPSSER